MKYCSVAEMLWRTPLQHYSTSLIMLMCVRNVHLHILLLSTTIIQLACCTWPYCDFDNMLMNCSALDQMMGDVTRPWMRSLTRSRMSKPRTAVKHKTADWCASTWVLPSLKAREPCWQCPLRSPQNESPPTTWSWKTTTDRPNIHSGEDKDASNPHLARQAGIHEITFTMRIHLRQASSYPLVARKTQRFWPISVRWATSGSYPGLILSPGMDFL